MNMLHCRVCVYCYLFPKMAVAIPAIPLQQIIGSHTSDSWVPGRLIHLLSIVFKAWKVVFPIQKRFLFPGFDGKPSDFFRGLLAASSTVSLSSFDRGRNNMSNPPHIFRTLDALWVSPVGARPIYSYSWSFIRVFDLQGFYTLDKHGTPKGFSLPWVPSLWCMIYGSGFLCEHLS